MSCAFFWTLLGLFGAIVVGVLQVDPNTLDGWIVTIVARGCPPCRRPSLPGYTRPEAVAGLFAKLVRFKLPARWYLASLIPLGVVALAVWLPVNGSAPEGGVR